MTTFIKLSKTPIREIVFTISFKEKIAIENLDAFIFDKDVKENYPNIKKGFNIQVEVNPDNKQAIPPKTLFDGYIVRNNEDQPKIIQVRLGTFALHKIKGYESFDVLQKEVFYYWNILEKYTGKLTISNINVRYLNFIDKDENETVSDLIKINVKHPFGDDIENCFNNIKINDVKNRITSNIVTTLGKDGNKPGVILDIILNKNNIDNNLNITDTLKELRNLKNDYFFKSITESTIKKYS